MFGFLYITTNLVNGMKYVGRRKKDKYGIWKSYIGSGRAFRKAVKKYGKENFQREIIKWCETEDELNNAEKTLIEELNAVNDRNYYNLSNGGKTTSGYHIPEDAKKIIAEKVKNSYTQERRDRYSELMRTNNPNKDGHVFRGKKLSNEQIENLRKINTGKSGLKGEKNPMYGRTGKNHPSYGKKNPFARSVRCIETNETFSTLREAGEKYNISSSQISLCCKGINKTCNGLHWEYVGNGKYEQNCSIETKKKISESKIGIKNPMAKPVLCIETGIIYGAAYEAGRAYGIRGERISACCKGRSHTSAGKHWRYLTDDELTDFRNKKRNDEYEGYKE